VPVGGYGALVSIPESNEFNKRDGRAKRSKLVDDLKLAPRIDGQPLAPLVVQSKQHDRGLDRGRFAHRLDVAEMLHLLAADQVDGPAFQIGISRWLRPRLPIMALDDLRALAELDVAKRILT
jgi:hypothetical protein